MTRSHRTVGGLVRTSHKFPFKNAQKKRVGRPRAHFSFSGTTMSDSKMDGGSDSKRAKTHEAHLIPGVDGRMTFGFPNSIVTKLRYADFFTLTAASGVVSSQIFRANSVFDPDFTGTGHQPMYFDQWAAIYDQYVVLGAKITAEFTSTSSTLSQIVGIVGDDDATISGVLTNLLEQNNGYSAVQHAGTGAKTITATFAPMEMFGVDAKDDGSSQTPVTTNPSEEWYWKCYSIFSDGLSATTTFLKVEIEYTVKFSELKSPTQS